MLGELANDRRQMQSQLAMNRQFPVATQRFDNLQASLDAKDERNELSHLAKDRQVFLSATDDEGFVTSSTAASSRSAIISPRYGISEIVTQRKMVRSESEKPGTFHPEQMLGANEKENQPMRLPKPESARTIAAFRNLADIEIKTHQLRWDAPEEKVAASERTNSQSLYLCMAMGLLAGMLATAAIFGIFAPDFSASESMRRAASNTDAQEVLSEVEQAVATAKSALQSKTWEELANRVRYQSEVRAGMERYYKVEPYAPLVMVFHSKPVRSRLGGESWQMVAHFDHGPPRAVLMERKNNEWRIDWEMLVDFNKWEWREFLTTRPKTWQPMRVTVSRAAGLSKHFADAGCDRKDAMALQIWCHDRNDSLIAILPRGTALFDRLEAMEWSIGKMLVVELAFPMSSSLQDRVEIREVIKERWVREDSWIVPAGAMGGKIDTRGLEIK